MQVTPWRIEDYRDKKVKQKQLDLKYISSKVPHVFEFRVSLSFFYQTLKTKDFLTDDVRPITIFLLKHLTSKVYHDSISGDSAPISGGNELIEIEFQIR